MVAAGNRGKKLGTMGGNGRDKITLGRGSHRNVEHQRRQSHETRFASDGGNRDLDQPGAIDEIGCLQLPFELFQDSSQRWSAMFDCGKRLRSYPGHPHLLGGLSDRTGKTGPCRHCGEEVRLRSIRGVTAKIARGPIEPMDCAGRHGFGGQPA